MNGRFHGRLNPSGPHGMGRRAFPRPLSARIPTLCTPQELEGRKRFLLEKTLSEAHPKTQGMRVKDAIIFGELTKGLHQGLA